jgi:arylsulfatase A-like enzyme
VTRVLLGALTTSLSGVCCSDTGWGDVGYHGGRAKTPQLDAMAAAPGTLRLERFYSGAPVCSPTRASIQTGRTPRRDCIFGVEVHALPKSEFTLAKAAKRKGYATAHFGKWHLGSLDVGGKDGSDGHLPQMSPLDAGYSDFVSTPQCGCSTNTNCGCLHPLSSCITGHYNSSADHMVFPCQQYFLGGGAVPTADAGGADGSIVPYGGGTEQTPNDDAEFLLDSFEAFLNRSLSSNRPFLACIHFHNVHIPYVATEPFRALYPGATSNEKDYWGGLSMMDAQIGRLRTLLRLRGVAHHTAVFFATDNGPEVGALPDPAHPGTFPVRGWPYFPDPGVTGPPTRAGGRLPYLRGRKRDRKF